MSTATATETETKMERATEPQNGSICHIEFTTPDLTKAQAFYSKLFGWEFQAFQPTEMYFMTPKSWGPCGCMLQGPAAADARTMIYVNVQDIGATLAQGSKLGATTIKQKTEIPGGHGFFAHMKAPDGNVWGIYCRS